MEKKSPGRLYLPYLIFLITLIYTVDEVASQIGMLMKTEVANDLFARFGDSSVGALAILEAIGLPFQFLGLLYRPLADRFGRKPFLVVNTLCMSLALGLIWLSGSIPVYFLGACLVQFFIPHDMHVVYIMETAPDRHRARIYGCVKFVATLGVMLIPVLRRLLMHSAGQWRRVYLVPAVVGMGVSLLALLGARETPVFLRSRGQTRQEASKGGLIPALKYAMGDRQLRWLYIAAALANLGFLGTLNYQVTMSYGFAQGLYGDTSQATMELVSTGPVTQALLLFPLGCALAQLVPGFLSDTWGRKSAAIAMAVSCLAAFLGFCLGPGWGMAPWAVGLLCGLCIGCYYSLNDVIIMMVGESAPTALRASVMSAQFVVTAIGGGLSFLIGLPLLTLLGNAAMGPVSFGLMVPGFLAAILVLLRNTRDTRGAAL